MINQTRFAQSPTQRVSTEGCGVCRIVQCSLRERVGGDRPCITDFLACATRIEKQEVLGTSLYYHVTLIEAHIIRSMQMDRPHDELQLSSVVKVRAIPPKENQSMFHFEIHFSGDKGGSPWILRAYTQVYRKCVLKIHILTK